MKLTSPFLLPALCWQLATATASAPHGDVYIFDPSSQQPRPDRTLSPVAARLVLAQRGGLEDFHSANLYDKDVIEAINDYGRPSPLFSHQPASHGTVESALILVNGLSEEDGMEHAPHFSQGLVTNELAQLQLRPTHPGPNSPTSKSPLCPQGKAHKSSSTTSNCKRNLSA